MWKRLSQARSVRKIPYYSYNPLHKCKNLGIAIFTNIPSIFNMAETEKAGKPFLFDQLSNLTESNKFSPNIWVQWTQTCFSWSGIWWIISFTLNIWRNANCKPQVYRSQINQGVSLHGSVEHKVIKSVVKSVAVSYSRYPLLHSWDCLAGIVWDCLRLSGTN